MENKEQDQGKRKKQKLDYHNSDHNQMDQNIPLEEQEEEKEKITLSEEKLELKEDNNDNNNNNNNCTKNGKQFILVHGPCHGGWVWYKVVTQLRLAGHRVTAIDLSGCGADPRGVDDVKTFDDHVAPLMEALAAVPPDEKVVAVSHCFGGFALSLAMERFPNRFSVAVFATALMPKHWSSPATTLDEFLQRDYIDSLMDCKLCFDQGRENPLTSYTFGPEFMEKIMYQCSPPEDATLASLLVRPAGLYLEDISNETMLSKENYGSVNRVYIISKQDKLYTEDYQRWIVDGNPPKEVREMEGSDHMLMLSRPRELVKHLIEIAEKYA